MLQLVTCVADSSIHIELLHVVNDFLAISLVAAKKLCATHCYSVQKSQSLLSQTFSVTLPQFSCLTPTCCIYRWLAYINMYKLYFVSLVEHSMQQCRSQDC